MVATEPGKPEEMSIFLKMSRKNAEKISRQVREKLRNNVMLVLVFKMWMSECQPGETSRKMQFIFCFMPLLFITVGTPSIVCCCSEIVRKSFPCSRMGVATYWVGC